MLEKKQAATNIIIFTRGNIVISIRVSCLIISLTGASLKTMPNVPFFVVSTII